MDRSFAIYGEPPRQLLSFLDRSEIARTSQSGVRPRSNVPFEVPFVVCLWGVVIRVFSNEAITVTVERVN